MTARRRRRLPESFQLRKVLRNKTTVDCNRRQLQKFGSLKMLKNSVLTRRPILSVLPDCAIFVASSFLRSSSVNWGRTLGGPVKKYAVGQREFHFLHSADFLTSSSGAAALGSNALGQVVRENLGGNARAVEFRFRDGME